MYDKDIMLKNDQIRDQKYFTKQSLQVLMRKTQKSLHENEENGDKPKNVKSTNEHERIEDQIQEQNISPEPENSNGNKDIDYDIQEIISFSENSSIFDEYLKVDEGGKEERQGLEGAKFIFLKRNFQKSEKVTNQPKHYFRMFKSRYEEFLNSSFYLREEIKQIKKVINNLDSKYKNQTYKITMKDIEKLFQPTQTISAKLARKNREVLQKILHSDLCSNSSIKNRLRHMISSRVYALRCISRELVKRNAIH